MTDIGSLTHTAVKILQAGDADAAHAFVTSTRGEMNDWLPEAFVLLNTNGLSEQQRSEMTQRIFGASSPELADIGARVGVYGFSFPVWRYLTQCFNGATLAERFGMTRLKRDSDMRDETLPEPARHRFGPGYALEDGNTYIEYRRAYILCSQKTDAGTATLVIRNNNHYFGRDRLAAPAYVSRQPFTVAELQALTEETLEKSFMRLQDTGADTRLKDIAALLDTFDRFESKMQGWLKSRNGLKHLEAFIEDALTRIAPKPFIAEIDPARPPWAPQKAQQVTTETARKLSAIFNAVSGKKRIALLSGPTGDYPTPML